MGTFFKESKKNYNTGSINNWEAFLNFYNKLCIGLIIVILLFKFILIPKMFQLIKENNNSKKINIEQSKINLSL